MRRPLKIAMTECWDCVHQLPIAASRNCTIRSVCSFWTKRNSHLSDDIWSASVYYRYVYDTKMTAQHKTSWKKICGNYHSCCWRRLLGRYSDLGKFAQRRVIACVHSIRVFIKAGLDLASLGPRSKSSYNILEIGALGVEYLADLLGLADRLLRMSNPKIRMQFRHRASRGASGLGAGCSLIFIGTEM